MIPPIRQPPDCEPIQEGDNAPLPVIAYLAFDCDVSIIIAAWVMM